MDFYVLPTFELRLEAVVQISFRLLNLHHTHGVQNKKSLGNVSVKKIWSEKG